MRRVRQNQATFALQIVDMHRNRSFAAVDHISDYCEHAIAVLMRERQSPSKVTSGNWARSIEKNMCKIEGRVGKRARGLSVVSVAASGIKSWRILLSPFTHRAWNSITSENLTMFSPTRQTSRWPVQGLRQTLALSQMHGAEAAALILPAKAYFLITDERPWKSR